MSQAPAVTSTSSSSKAVGGSPKSKFNEWGLEYGKLLSDDYSHDKLFSVKYTAKGSLFNVSAKGTLAYPAPKDDKKDCGACDNKAKDTVNSSAGGEKAADKSQPSAEKQEDKKPTSESTTTAEKPAKTCDEKACCEKPVPSSEVKIITQVEGKNIETKFDSKGIRTWADLGDFKLKKDNDLNVTAKLKTTSAFESASGWVSGEYRGEKCNASARFELKKGLVPFVNKKVVITHGDFKAGVQVKVGWKDSKLAWRRHNFFVNYHHKDFDVFAEHITNTKRDAWKIGTLVGAAVYRAHADHTIVVKGTWDTANIGAALGVVSRINNKTGVRAKFELNEKGKFVSLVTKYTHNKNVSVAVGTSLNVGKFDANINKNRCISFPLGVNVEFTY